MLRLEYVYWLLGAFLVFTAAANLHERRFAVAGFWAILACPFLFGEAIAAALASGSRWPAQAMGVGVLALGVLASRSRSTPALVPDRKNQKAAILGRTSSVTSALVLDRGNQKAAIPGRTSQLKADHPDESSVRRFGNCLFGPALLIPLVTLLLALGGPHLHWNGAALLDAKQATLVALGLACSIAFVAALRVTGASVGVGLGEGRRLLDAMGWAALLPMLLATLGSVFAATGVGDAIAALVGDVIPVDSALACLLAFALGMVVFTTIMGNAFAAFPVMMAGIGLPLLVQRHGAAPAVLGSLGMLTGYCGTLLTPMAANFNIVPAVLLDLRDQYGVIRAQWPTALALLAVNVVLMLLLVWR
jgi:uncharacterized membrane protein